jgi:hypothetical protein
VKYLQNEPEKNFPAVNGSSWYDCYLANW